MNKIFTLKIFKGRVSCMNPTRLQWIPRRSAKFPFFTIRRVKSGHDGSWKGKDRPIPMEVPPFALPAVTSWNKKDPEVGAGWDGRGAAGRGGRKGETKKPNSTGKKLRRQAHADKRRQRLPANRPDWETRKRSVVLNSASYLFFFCHASSAAWFPFAPMRSLQSLDK